ncbi:hypothetical protein Tco_0067490 [Tanacetum coccineum]
MPLPTYLNLGLGELAHTKFTVELADRTVKYPKGIAENVLVGIGKSVFPVDFIILDMPEDIKNNMPPKRTSIAAARAATPMTAAVVEPLIEARVSAALANHETLRNHINGHGNGSHNSHSEIKGTVHTPCELKGTDVASYTLHFQELALMCERMFREESDEVEKYVGGLPDMIWGNVMCWD